MGEKESKEKKERERERQHEKQEDRITQSSGLVSQSQRMK